LALFAALAALGCLLRGLERLQHEVEEVIAGGEGQVLCECAQVFEEGLPGWDVAGRTAG
jgi:hypothetical protein